MKPLRAWRETSLRFSSNRIFWRLTGPYIKVLQHLCHWSYPSKTALFKTQSCKTSSPKTLLPGDLFLFISACLLDHITTTTASRTHSDAPLCGNFFSYLCCQMTSSWWGGACGRWSSKWWRLTPALTALLPQTLSSTVRENPSKERSVRDLWTSGLFNVKRPL